MVGRDRFAIGPPCVFRQVKCVDQPVLANSPAICRRIDDAARRIDSEQSFVKVCQHMERVLVLRTRRVERLGIATIATVNYDKTGFEAAIEPIVAPGTATVRCTEYREQQYQQRFRSNCHAVIFSQGHVTCHRNQGFDISKHRH
jgi:hypothetical protein